jgi:hypothetical protein
MKKAALLAGALLFCFYAQAQSVTSPTATPPGAPAAATQPTPAKIDPAKEADIRRLLELSGTQQMMLQTVSQMATTMKPLMTNALPPGDYREKLVELFFAKFLSKDLTTGVLDLTVPLYAKYFTDAEIGELIAFYQSPVGRKLVSVNPQLLSDVQQGAMKLGQELGGECMREVIAENPDLIKQAEAAGKAPSPK